MTYQAEPLDQQICFTLYTTHMAVMRVYKPLLDRMGLTYPQYLVLNMLDAAQSATIGDIGAALHLESSTVTPLVKRLEAAGRVVRQRDAKDERKVMVTMTAAGRAILMEAGCLGERLLERSGQDDPALGVLNDQLKDLRDTLIAGA